MRLWVLFTWLMGCDPFAQWVHTLKEGKCHIEFLCEILEMWGRGLGLDCWSFVSHVQMRRIPGFCFNPAKQLYEWFEFVDHNPNVISHCRTLLALFCVLGLWHCGFWRTGMEKDLSLSTPMVWSDLLGRVYFISAFCTLKITLFPVSCTCLYNNAESRQCLRWALVPWTKSKFVNHSLCCTESQLM